MISPYVELFQLLVYAAQKMNFSIRDFLSKCDQTPSSLKSLLENFIFCAVILSIINRRKSEDSTEQHRYTGEPISKHDVIADYNKAMQGVNNLSCVYL